MPEIDGLPAAGPTTLAAVKERLRITDAADDDRLQDLVDATNARVRGWNVARLALDADPVAWPADVILGTTMLCCRLWRRKDSPAGTAPVGDVVFVASSDADVAMLLRLGSYAAPGVG